MPRRPKLIIAYEGEDNNGSTSHERPRGLRDARPVGKEEDNEERASEGTQFPFSEVALFPEPFDNCAIATKEIPAQATLLMEPEGSPNVDRRCANGGKNVSEVLMKRKILVGHRFCVNWLAKGTKILSWGIPFGIVTAENGVEAGEYLCNERMLQSLRNWGIEDLPEIANFKDYIAPYEPKEAKVTDQVPLITESEGKELKKLNIPNYFMGYPRTGKRKGLYGTRNYILILGTTSLTAPFVEAVGRHFRRRRKTEMQHKMRWRMKCKSKKAKTTGKHQQGHGRGISGEVLRRNAQADKEDIPFDRHTVQSQGGGNDEKDRGTEVETEVEDEGVEGGDAPQVVSVAHTETANKNNHEVLVRTLAAFVCHQNVAKCLVVDRGEGDSLQGPELVNSIAIQELKMPIEADDICFHSLIDTPSPALAKVANSEQRGEEPESGYARSFRKCVRILERWQQELSTVSKRVKCPLSGLSVALQCGGSDAFSGVSGNPTAGWAARTLIQCGGKALLAETDELIGAENYVLRRVKDLKTARDFQRCVERFKRRMHWHGQTAESNPSGGNNLRGLYNIALKSLGAAKKKHIDVRLDGVLKYGEYDCMRERGYYFMDSPGNDLESLAGQVASGCNLILFITGNGSITNFPFVPTIKILTTSARYALLADDMDFNAGLFQEGTPLSELGFRLFGDIVAVASGMVTKGEKASHSQVSIWRNWAQSCLNEDLGKEAGQKLRPLSAKPYQFGRGGRRLYRERGKDMMHGFKLPNPVRCKVESVGLIMPTSLCSGQIANLIAEDLNEDVARARAAVNRKAANERDERKKGKEDKGNRNEETHGKNAVTGNGQDSTKEGSRSLPFERFVALTHTEGCGMGYAHGEDEIFMRILAGHSQHPSVKACLFLEHGCEKAHNGYVRARLEASKGFLGPQNGWKGLGFASVQLDGGIEKVKEKAKRFFMQQALEEGKLEGGDTSWREVGEDARGSRNDGFTSDLKGAKSKTFVFHPQPYLNVPCIVAILTNPLSLRLKGRANVKTTSREKLLDHGEVSETSSALSNLVHALIQAGAYVVVPETALLLLDATFLDMICETRSPEPNLAFAQALGPVLQHETFRKSEGAHIGPDADKWTDTRHSHGGLYIMASPTDDWAETLTGLAAVGSVLAVASSSFPLVSHPFLPVLRVTSSSQRSDSACGATQSPVTPATSSSAACSSSPSSPLPLQSCNSGWTFTFPHRDSKSGSNSWSLGLVRSTFDILERKLARAPTMGRCDVTFQVTRGLTGVSA